MSCLLAQQGAALAGKAASSSVTRERLGRTRCRAPARPRLSRAAATSEGPGGEQPAQAPVLSRVASALAAVVVAVTVGEQAALALPPPSSDPKRCEVENLTKFAKTRAAFSLEVGTGAMPEAVLDLRGCDFSKLNLNEGVLSGSILTGANFEGTSLVHAELSRVTARSANFKGANLTDANLYEVSFNGSDLRGAVFTNAIMSSATFGKDETGKWANLEGVDFEGALLSSSDARTMCSNPTLDDYGKAIIGCR